MERCRHRQHEGALGTCGLEGFAGALHPDSRAGDDGLRRIVEIDGFRDFPVMCVALRANVPHGGGIQPQNGGHCSCAHRHGLLHGGSAKPHQWRRLGQRERSCGHQSGIFSQRVTRQHDRPRPAFGAPHAPGRNARHQHHRLGVGGECQLFLAALTNQPAHVLAQGVRGLLQRGAHHGMVTPAIEHARRLGTLAGKDKCNWMCH